MQLSRTQVTSAARSAAARPTRPVAVPTPSTSVKLIKSGVCRAANLDANTPEEEWQKFYEAGTYSCAGCGTPLFTSDMKFDSGCGWPAFFDEIPDTVKYNEDISMGMRRVEIVCKNCDGHLGHVFENEGFPNPTNKRHCVNSLSITFEPKK